MKVLVYRRHSKKDGPNNTIGPVGLEMAIAAGRQDHKVYINPVDCYSRGFAGLLVRTWQTLVAFCVGLNYPVPSTLIEGIGSDELFAQMVTPEFREEVKKGTSNLLALLKVHPAEKVLEWRKLAFNAVLTMFSQMEDGEIAMAFGHSPMIELAALEINRGLPRQDFIALNDLEGIRFEMLDDDENEIFAVDKISYPPENSL